MTPPYPRPGSGGRESETQRRQALETRVCPAVCVHAGPGAEAERRTGADRDAAPRCPASGGEAVVGAGAASPPGHRGPQPTARRPPLVCPGQSPVPARSLPRRRAGLARVPEPPSVCPVRACVCLRESMSVAVCVCARRCFCVSCRPCECASPDSCPRVRPASAPAHPARLPRPRSRPAARPQLNGEGTEPAEASLVRASDCASHGLSAQARHTDWAA